MTDLNKHGAPRPSFKRLLAEGAVRMLIEGAAFAVGLLTIYRMFGN